MILVGGKVALGDGAGKREGVNDFAEVIENGFGALGIVVTVGRGGEGEPQGDLVWKALLNALGPEIVSLVGNDEVGDGLAGEATTQASLEGVGKKSSVAHDEGGHLVKAGVKALVGLVKKNLPTRTTLVATDGIDAKKQKLALPLTAEVDVGTEHDDGKGAVGISFGDLGRERKGGDSLARAGGHGENTATLVGTPGADRLALILANIEPLGQDKPLGCRAQTFGNCGVGLFFLLRGGVDYATRSH